MPFWAERFNELKKQIRTYREDDQFHIDIDGAFVRRDWFDVVVAAICRRHPVGLGPAGSRAGSASRRRPIFNPERKFPSMSSVHARRPDMRTQHRESRWGDDLAGACCSIHVGARKRPARGENGFETVCEKRARRRAIRRQGVDAGDGEGDRVCCLGRRQEEDLWPPPPVLVVSD